MGGDNSGGAGGAGKLQGIKLRIMQVNFTQQCAHPVIPRG